jgi:hypothetical protein
VEKPNHFITGKSYENHLAQLLREQNNFVSTSQNIGMKPSGTGHIVDILLNGKIIVSAKLQNKIGTTEEKIPYEQLMLQSACDRMGYEKAYIVCAGNGWTQLNYYLSDAYNEMMNTPKVSVWKHEDFLKVLPTL